MQIRSKVLLAVGLSLSVLAMKPAMAHDELWSWSSKTVYNPDEEGSPTWHNIEAWAQLASPLHNGQYTRGYLGGSLPIRSGSSHKVALQGDPFETVDVYWIGSLFGSLPFLGEERTTEDSMEQVLDQDGFWVNYLILSASSDISNAAYGSYYAAIDALLEDRTWPGVPLADRQITHSHQHNYEIIQ